MANVMIKRIINVCIVVIFIFSFCGCAQTTKDTPIAETGNVKTENTEREDEEETDAESAEPIYTIQSQLMQNDTYEMKGWQIAYAEYIESIDGASFNKYALIYVDEDDIPELVIYTGTYATVDALQTWSLQCNYIEKKTFIGIQADIWESFMTMCIPSKVVNGFM